MKTILDKYSELYLASISEDDTLICNLLTMKTEKGNCKVPDFNGFKFQVCINNISDYFVLQELTHVALGLDYFDDGHLTECKSSNISDVLKIQDIGMDNEVKHYVLRTAHCVVHIFTTDIPRVSKT